VEKNAAMRAFGAELIEFGEDFDEAREEAFRVATEEDLFIVPPFHRELVRGVATYGYELFRAVPDLDAVYVPIGCGSGICGTIAARDALGAKAEIIGVVSENAPTAKLSVEAGARWRPRAAAPSPTGWPCACRCPRRWRSIRAGCCADHDRLRRGGRRGDARLLHRHPQPRRRGRCRAAGRADAGTGADGGPEGRP
jgi:hypothetical protein